MTIQMRRHNLPRKALAMLGRGVRQNGCALYGFQAFERNELGVPWTDTDAGQDAWRHLLFMLRVHWILRVLVRFCDD